MILPQGLLSPSRSPVTSYLKPAFEFDLYHHFPTCQDQQVGATRITSEQLIRGPSSVNEKCFCNDVRGLLACQIEYGLSDLLFGA